MDHLGEGGVDGLAIELAGLEGLDVGGVLLGDDLGELGREAGELRVGADEVGLAGELEDGAGLAVIRDKGGNGALVGVAAGALDGLGDAHGAQDVDGLLEVALGLDEGLLALHHRGVGHLAELLDERGGNLSHVLLLWIKTNTTSRLERRYSAAGASAVAAISSAVICSLPVPARTASAAISHMRATERMASSFAGMP